MTSWIIFNIFLLLVIFCDLYYVGRGSGEVSIKKAFLLSGIWAATALLFAGFIFIWQGSEQGMQFLTGYIIEQSLSLDNVFIFVIVFSQFKIERKYQHRVLFWGVISACIMRLGLILLGSAIVSKYHWVLYVFGGFLVFTGIKLLFSKDSSHNTRDGAIVRVLKKILPPVKEDYQGKHFFVKENGKLFITPLLFTLIIIEIMDLVFAVDSIPAIFAVTQDPFIIYTSNAFAIMGLRSLYFVIAHVVTKLRYIQQGLSLVLVFIGGKMLATKWVTIPSSVSLLVTVGILGAATLLSLAHKNKLSK